MALAMRRVSTRLKTVQSGYGFVVQGVKTESGRSKGKAGQVSILVRCSGRDLYGGHRAWPLFAPGDRTAPIRDRKAPAAPPQVVVELFCATDDPLASLLREVPRLHAISFSRVRVVASSVAQVFGSQTFTLRARLGSTSIIVDTGLPSDGDPPVPSGVSIPEDMPSSWEEKTTTTTVMKNKKKKKKHKKKKMKNEGKGKEKVGKTVVSVHRRDAKASDDEWGFAGDAGADALDMDAPIVAMKPADPARDDAVANGPPSAAVAPSVPTMPMPPTMVPMAMAMPQLQPGYDAAHTSPGAAAWPMPMIMFMSPPPGTSAANPHSPAPSMMTHMQPMVHVAAPTHVPVVPAPSVGPQRSNNMGDNTANNTRTAWNQADSQQEKKKKAPRKTRPKRTSKQAEHNKENRRPVPASGRASQPSMSRPPPTTMVQPPPAPVPSVPAAASSDDEENELAAASRNRSRVIRVLRQVVSQLHDDVNSSATGTGNVTGSSIRSSDSGSGRGSMSSSGDAGKPSAPGSSSNSIAREVAPDRTFVFDDPPPLADFDGLLDVSHPALQPTIEPTSSGDEPQQLPPIPSPARKRSRRDASREDEDGSATAAATTSKRSTASRATGKDKGKGKGKDKDKDKGKGKGKGKDKGTARRSVTWQVYEDPNDDEPRGASGSHHDTPAPTKRPRLVTRNSGKNKGLQQQPENRGALNTVFWNLRERDSLTTLPHAERLLPVHLSNKASGPFALDKTPSAKLHARKFSDGTRQQRKLF